MDYDSDPPGPIDNSVLYEQSRHVSSAVWDGEERGILRCHEHTVKLDKWFLTKQQVELVEKAGFGHLRSIPSMGLDNSLISALVERWRRETNTFHLKVGEMTITLEDVAFILGLPIDGKPVTGITSTTCDSSCMKLLGKTPGSEYSKGGMLKLTWLVEAFSNCPGDAYMEYVEQCTRAYLLYLVGSTIFCTTSGNTVPVMYLQLFENFDEIKTYAWGAAALSFLYRSLGNASLQEQSTISGSLTLLQCWSYEHLNIGLPNLVPGVPHCFPIALKWKGKRNPPPTNRDLAFYRRALDNLESCDVTWCPYASVDILIVPEEIKRDVIMGRSSTMLICFDKAERHLPERCLRQYGMQQHIPENVKSWERKSRGVDDNIDLSKKMQKEISEWSDRRKHIVHGGILVHDDEYMQWYLKITRKFVGRPKPLASEFVKMSCALKEIACIVDAFSMKGMDSQQMQSMVKIKEVLHRSFENSFEFNVETTSKSKIKKRARKKKPENGSENGGCSDKCVDSFDVEQHGCLETSFEINMETTPESKTKKRAGRKMQENGSGKGWRKGKCIFSFDMEQPTEGMQVECDKEMQVTDALIQVDNMEPLQVVNETSDNVRKVERETNSSIVSAEEGTILGDSSLDVQVDISLSLLNEKEPTYEVEDPIAVAAATSTTAPTTIVQNPLPSSPPPPPVLSSPAQIPLSWPNNGKLTIEWIQDIMSTFDWSSRNLAPSEFPSVLPVSVLNGLVNLASKILHKEPNCVSIEGAGPTSRVVIVGDIHGQLHDVMFLLQDAGFPTENQFYVFNGNYVGKGAWGLETFLILLAWKVFMPHRVYLLRGNQETKSCSSVYGFEKEVLIKYGDMGIHVYHSCLECFKELPLASLIVGNVYTTHGGLFRTVSGISTNKSKGRKRHKVDVKFDTNRISLGSLEELFEVKRTVLDPMEEGFNLIPGDVLWSNPSISLGLLPNKKRGIGLFWGPDCTEDFLKKFQLKLIIRSHEGPDARNVQSELAGMNEGFTIDHVVESGQLITLFSAPDYPQFQATEYRYNNKGAYILLEPPNFDTPVFHTIEAITPRPKVNPYYDYRNIIN